MDKNELLEAFEKTEKNHKFSKDKYLYAKNCYDMKDKEYIEKFSHYQDLINPNLLVPIKKSKINNDKSKKYINKSSGNIIYNGNKYNINNDNNKDNGKFRKLEEYKFNEKNGGKIRMRASSKKLSTKKLINKNNSNNAISTSTTISTGNINFNTDEKLLNSTFNRTFKFNKTKNK